MPLRVFGEIEGATEGDSFADRRALSAAGVHRPNQAGISGSEAEGADSIVLSGGYEDDKDYGTVIVIPGTADVTPIAVGKYLTKLSAAAMLRSRKAKCLDFLSELCGDIRWIPRSLQSVGIVTMACTGWTNFGKKRVGLDSRCGGFGYGRMMTRYCHL